MGQLDEALKEVFDAIAATGLTDETTQALRAIFDDDLLLAALDLVDHKCVLKYKSPWERTFYWVQSTADPSTATSIYLLGEQSMIPWSCECPAFVKRMLLGNDFVMCKHILAATLAEKTKTISEQEGTPHDLSQLLEGQVPS